VPLERDGEARWRCPETGELYTETVTKTDDGQLIETLTEASLA
jgi:hypothetical protein